MPSWSQLIYCDSSPNFMGDGLLFIKTICFVCDVCMLDRIPLTWPIGFVDVVSWFHHTIWSSNLPTSLNLSHLASTYTIRLTSSLKVEE